MIRVGFAGAGFIAGIHAEVLGELPDARVAAVFDPDRERAEAFAAKTGAPAVASFDALLSEVEAIYVCTPNTLHAEQAIAALDAGLHVFSEKPVATSLADARRVREAAAKARGVYQIGFNKRFAPIYRAVKERIDSGVLTPRWALLKMNRGDLHRPPWVADPALTGGFLYETPIHVLDLARWLFGPPREVFCRAAQTCSQQLDDFAAVLTFQSGLSAAFCSSAHTTWLFPFERVEVYGEHAIAVTEEMDWVTLQLGLDAEPETIDVSQLPIAERWGYRAEDEAFLAALRGERPPAVGAEDGALAVELVDALYRSAETGQPVGLGE
jgi:myo-inositol 2-dehydrogenase/D-chiro-inositol 1-dehydrogenase